MDKSIHVLFFCYILCLLHVLRRYCLPPLFPNGLIQPPMYALQQLLKIVVVKTSLNEGWGPKPLAKSRDRSDFKNSELMKNQHKGSTSKRWTKTS
jgi:hypothetical protein